MTDPNSITGAIVDSSFRLYKAIGPGLLESVYETVLSRDIPRKGFRVERQKWISFEYEGLWFENAFCIDLLVENAVVVEVKSAVRLHPNHYKQTLTYMRLAECKLGLLLNFGAPTFREVVKRLILCVCVLSASAWESSPKCHRNIDLASSSASTSRSISPVVLYR